MKPKPIPCPECGSFKIALVEHATTYLTHYWDDVDGYQEPGEIKKVVLECRECKHSHTMRGIVQMDDDLKGRLLKNEAAVASPASLKPKQP